MHLDPVPTDPHKFFKACSVMVFFFKILSLFWKFVSRHSACDLMSCVVSSWNHTQFKCYFFVLFLKVAYTTTLRMLGYHLGPLSPSWIRNYTYYKLWDGITYPLTHFNGATVENWEWILISSHSSWSCDYLSTLGLMLIHVSKRGPWQILCHKWRCQVLKMM